MKKRVVTYPPPVQTLIENHENATALLHLKLADQQLASTSNNSSIVQTMRVLVDDAINFLGDKEPQKALIHLKLVEQSTPMAARNESTTAPGKRF